jgi:hypothetical protein
LRGRCFAMRKKTEKMMGWTVSPLKKSRADSVLPGPPFFYFPHKRPELAPSLVFFLNSRQFELNGRIKSSLFLWRENIDHLSRSLPGPLFRHSSLLIDRSCPVDFLSLIAELCVNVEISQISEKQHHPPKGDLLVISRPILGHFWACAP